MISPTIAAAQLRQARRQLAGGIQGRNDRPKSNYVLEMFSSSGTYCAHGYAGHRQAAQGTRRREQRQQAASKARNGSRSTTAGITPDEEPPPLADDPHHRRDAHDHRAQRLARYRLRPLDQPVSRLRARLHLLLCAAEPRLSRPVARPRFRDPHLLQAASRGAARGRNCARRATPAARSRSAATPIRTSRPSAGSGSPASILEVLRDFRHPVTIVTKGGADPARHRHSRRYGAATVLRSSRFR